ncbi:hypothetical protein [Companilactobacillus furfuricola]|uniref:hypothetical protein n=1 Tax=Companilactobacillus furfuricola TaxID=1462575 RepID=UPI0013DD96E1|nr:hypothetical protein [Companilactobacillus furfuricola]
MHEQEAKAREEKRYSLLSNQKENKDGKSNVSQETRMSGAKSHEPRKEKKIEIKIIS